MSNDQRVQEFGDVVWLRLPHLASRRFASIGVALGDGAWMRASPIAAALAAPASFAVGNLLGLARPGPTYTSSVLVLLVLSLLAAVGAGTGTWTWAGYVVTELLFHWRSEGRLLGRAGEASAASRAWTLYVPRLLTALLLAVLLVMMPIIATGIRVQILRVLRLPVDAKRVVGPMLQGVLFGTGVALWAHATAFMIRPLWSFAGLTPDIEAIAPLQAHARLLGLVAGTVAAVRTAAAVHLAQRAPVPPTMLLPTRAATPWPWWVGAPARAALLTLLLSGLIAGTAQAAVVFLVMLATCSARSTLLPRLGSYVVAVSRIPLLLRLVAVGGVAWLMAGVVVQPAVDKREASFTWMLVAAVASTLFGAVLVPPAVPPAEPTEATRP